MCDSSAYLLKDGKEILILEHIDFFETIKNDIHLVNIFGEERLINAKIKSLSLLNHKIFLQPLPD
jgi:predicted RNA-binding protein